MTAADLKPQNIACKRIANEILPDENGIMRVIKVDKNCPGTLQVTDMQQDKWGGRAERICPEAVATHVAAEWNRMVVFTRACDTCGEEFQSRIWQCYAGCEIT